MSRRPTHHGDALTHENLRDDYAFCRTVGHAWEEYVDTELERPQYGWRFSVVCTRCGTRRHYLVDHNNGDTYRKSYDYPQGYKLDEKVTRSEMRMEWARRQNYDFIGVSTRKKAAQAV